MKVMCILNHPYLIYGKVYTVFDRTDRSIKVLNEIGNFELIPNVFFKEV